MKNRTKLKEIGKIGIIGGGHMASALISGWSSSRELCKKLTIAERNVSKRRTLSRRYGVQTVSSQEELPGDIEIMILAVKPSDVRGVCEKLTQKRCLIMSIAAGITTGALLGWIDVKPMGVLRVMPNTPFSLNAGMSVCYGRKLSSKMKSKITWLLGIGGEVLWMREESKLSLVTAVSGSGPAYIYYVAEAMEEAGYKLGLTRKSSRDLVAQTVMGGGMMLKSGGVSARGLREAVSVPGGTTERAIKELEKGDLSGMILSAMESCQERAEEISEELEESGK